MDSHGSIQGSRDRLAFDRSPGLIAVFHALHRLLVPRHPPHALSSLAALTPPPHRGEVAAPLPALRHRGARVTWLILSRLDRDSSTKTARAMHRAPQAAHTPSPHSCEATLTATGLSKNDRETRKRASVNTPRPVGRGLDSWVSLNCGDDRDRTGNLRLAKPALSQLSYVPVFSRQWAYLDSNQGPQLYQSCALAN
jgi:hypothetical protein